MTRLRLDSGPPAVVLWAVAALAALHAAVDARGARAVVVLRMRRVTHCHVRHVSALLEHGLRLPDLVQLLDGVHDLGVEGLGQRVPDLEIQIMNQRLRLKWDCAIFRSYYPRLLCPDRA